MRSTVCRNAHIETPRSRNSVQVSDETTQYRSRRDAALEKFIERERETKNNGEATKTFCSVTQPMHAEVVESFRNVGEATKNNKSKRATVKPSYVK